MKMTEQGSDTALNLNQSLNEEFSWCNWGIRTSSKLKFYFNKQQFDWHWCDILISSDNSVDVSLQWSYSQLLIAW